MELQEIATEAAEWFETAKRPAIVEDHDGDGFTRVKDGAPEWVTELVREAHGDMLPDDWRYDCIRAAVDWMAEGNGEDEAGEFADSQVDVYTSARIAWLGSHAARPGYCDEAADELGSEGQDIIGRIALGQYAEAEEVFHSVMVSLGMRSDALNFPETVDAE
jgi:hypothetical protein